MKKVSILIVLLAALLTIVGCSSDDENNSNNNTDSSEEDNGNNNDKDQSTGNDGYQELGEMGYATDAAGEIEFTPTEVEVFKSRDGETPFNDDEVFVVIDYTLKNVGDKPYEEGFISSTGTVELENSQENKAWEDSAYEFEFVDSLEKDVEPGETVEAQLVFIISESETSEYILTLKTTFDDTEDTKWLFNAPTEQ